LVGGEAPSRLYQRAKQDGNETAGRRMQGWNHDNDLELASIGRGFGFRLDEFTS